MTSFAIDKTFLLKDLQGNKMNVECGFYTEGDLKEVYFKPYSNLFYYKSEKNRLLKEKINVSSTRATLYTLKPDPAHWEDKSTQKVAFILKDFKIDWIKYFDEQENLKISKQMLRKGGLKAVSYTHLTLPTILRV